MPAVNKHIQLLIDTCIKVSAVSDLVKVGNLDQITTHVCATRYRQTVAS